MEIQRCKHRCQQCQNTHVTVVTTHLIDHLRKDCVSLVSKREGMEKSVISAGMLRGYYCCDLDASQQRSLCDIGCRLNTTGTNGRESSLSSDFAKWEKDK